MLNGLVDSILKGPTKLCISQGIAQATHTTRKQVSRVARLPKLLRLAAPQSSLLKKPKRIGTVAQQTTRRLRE